MLPYCCLTCFSSNYARCWFGIWPFLLVVYSSFFFPLSSGGVNKQNSGGKRICSVGWQLLVVSWMPRQLFPNGEKKKKILFCTVTIRFGNLPQKICLHLPAEFCGPLKTVLLNCYHFTRNTYLISVKGRVLKAIMRDTVALRQKNPPWPLFKWQKPLKSWGLLEATKCPWNVSCGYICVEDVWYPMELVSAFPGSYSGCPFYFLNGLCLWN